jgi:signal transduction histidine kinase
MPSDRNPTQNFEGIARSIKHIGNTYKLLGRNDSALAYLRRAIAVAEQIAYLPAVSEALLYIGEIHASRARYDSALAALYQSKAIEERLGQKQHLAATITGIAETLHKQGKNREAALYAEQAIAIADEISARPDKCAALLVAADVYQSLRKFNQSARYYQAYIALNDSLNSEAATREIAALEAQYEIDKIEKEMMILQAERARESAVRNSLLGGIFGLMFIIGLIVLSNIRIRRQSRELMEANNEILRQKELLERQSGEIELANVALNEKNYALTQQREILETQAREIQLANVALQEKNVQLNALNNEKNEFLGIAAHDLKNPLTHITMSVGSLERYFDRLAKEEIIENIRSVGVVAEHMRSIVSHLLDINAIERGGVEFHRVLFLVAPVISSIVAQSALAAERKNIVVHWSADAQTSNLQAFADEQAFVEVVDNLLSNAIKYSPLGKNVFVRAYGDGDGNIMRLEVQDEGAGISAEDMPKLFGKFARLTARPTAGEHSTGLGLSIVKKMVEAMNGRVWCESELGKGATFIVELPSHSQ